MRSWSTRRWRKGFPLSSARCPPGSDAVSERSQIPPPGVAYPGTVARDHMLRRRAWNEEPARRLKALMPDLRSTRNLHIALAAPVETLQGRHLAGGSRTDSGAYTDLH